MMRDTDLDWKTISETEPFYGVLTDSQFLSRNLDAAAIDRFYASGIDDIDWVWNRLKTAFGEFAPAVALDFGSGLGRLAFAMSRYASRVIGVDVAPKMISQAEAHGRGRGIENVFFTTEMPDERLDWINSFIVFQHIPPERGCQLLETLVSRLRPMGRISIQLTIFRERSVIGHTVNTTRFLVYDGALLRPVVMDDWSPAGLMSMFDYDLNRVLAILKSHGIGEVLLLPTNHSGNHGVYILGKREEPSEEIALGQKIDFTEDGNARKYQVEGWSHAEAWGTWTEGALARLRIWMREQPNRDLQLTADVQAFLHPEVPKQVVELELNGQPVATWEFDEENSSGTRTAKIPHALACSREKLDIVFKISDPKSPRSLAMSSDYRNLGMFVRWLELTEC
jgi:SAM-dependent methyltransferase